MDKRTLLAVVLSVVIISGGFFLQGLISPQSKTKGEPQTQVATSASEASPQVQPAAPLSSGNGAPATTQGTQGQPGAGTPGTPTSITSVVPAPTDAKGLTDETYLLQTDLVRVVFASRGGVVQKFELLKQLDNGRPLEMVNSGTSGETAFNLSFGGPNSPYTDALFHFTKVNDTTYQFSREFLAPGGVGNAGIPFLLTKTYVFHPRSYMMELKISVQNSVNAAPNLDAGGYAYTLQFGPQIGPQFAKLGEQGEFRHFYTYRDGKRATINVPAKGDKTIDQHISWTSIVGKYFTAIAIPDATKYAVTYSNKPIEGVAFTSQLLFSRPPFNSSTSSSDFQFYLGPKDPRILGTFDNPAKNAFGTSGLDLEKVVDTTPLLGWLEDILNFFLQLFYKLTPNWGVAIILLTVLIKLILYPFTRKSFESTSKMQALTPKLNELREKYKSNPTKLNQEMAALYKREGVSPLGGCLPLLLQMPVFFALYGLLNTEFQLRGAVFIPGWITDLSQPESILHFHNFAIPLLGWTDLRVLPFIYVGSQLLTSKLMQAPDSQANKNMLLITYLMPIMFFFILYNVPSGLLVYWTVTNLLSAVQQVLMNRARRRKPGLVRK